MGPLVGEVMPCFQLMDSSENKCDGGRSWGKGAASGVLSCKQPECKNCRSKLSSWKSEIIEFLFGPNIKDILFTLICDPKQQKFVALNFFMLNVVAQLLCSVWLHCSLSCAILLLFVTLLIVLHFFSLQLFITSSSSWITYCLPLHFSKPLTFLLR